MVASTRKARGLLPLRQVRSLGKVPDFLFFLISNVIIVQNLQSCFKTVLLCSSLLCLFVILLYFLFLPCPFFAGQRSASQAGEKNSRSSSEPRLRYHGLVNKAGNSARSTTPGFVLLVLWLPSEYNTYGIVSGSLNKRLSSVLQRCAPCAPKVPGWLRMVSTKVVRSALSVF